MYIDLELQSNLQPYVVFDWRLVAERGLRRYGHFHLKQREFKSVASCEIAFLKKVLKEEQENASKMYGSIPMQLEANTSSATRRAGHFKCVGAIRKAGFLSVKKWILKRKQSIELARKQGWKRYWVCLRGTALLFHSLIENNNNNNNNLGKEDFDQVDKQQTDLLSWVEANCGAQLGANLLEQVKASEDWKHENKLNYQDDCQGENNYNIEHNMSQCFIEREPRHLIIIDDAIAQPIPEHPKRDFVFCLSTTFGDAYLFQTSCQLECDNWISAIHNACAASIARDSTRDQAVKLFESKVRHLELEAEKKLFLKQRLESRLTSMSSMSHISALMSNSASNNPPSFNLTTKTGTSNAKSKESQEAQSKRSTMRTLLQRLNQQLLTLDNYIEQIHCEVYQLRCYLSSCKAQNIFNSSTLSGTNFVELPHPKSLLMHVSKVTKLLLIKMGVFTVSSFHAYIHARQESAQTILEKIRLTKNTQQTTRPDSSTDDCRRDSPVELLIRSSSISENLSSSFLKRNTELEEDTEKLIDISNLKSVAIRVNKSLFEKIRGEINAEQEFENLGLPGGSQEGAEDSDDRYSMDYEENFVVVNLKLHISSNCLSIIKQVLKIINPQVTAHKSLAFLEYYLKFITKSNSSLECESTTQKPLDSQEDDKSTNSSSASINNLRQLKNLSTLNEKQTKKNSLEFVAKRRDTLSDWSNFDCLELMEKIVFKLDLVKSRIDDDENGTPFGISIIAQLFSCKMKNLLNVFCGYIEWASVADKAGLRDDDEFLLINGVSVVDLDMMFIESIIRDETKLQLVVRSARSDIPAKASFVDKFSWFTKPNQDDDYQGNQESSRDGSQRGENQIEDKTNGNSKVITDEYISSLVCPPPPTQSKAFLRTDSSLLRQKSDLTSGRPTSNKTDPPMVSQANSSNTMKVSLERNKAQSQQNLDKNEDDQSEQRPIPAEASCENKEKTAVNDNKENADNDRKNSILFDSNTKNELVEEDVIKIGSEIMMISDDPNLIERLKKSIIELLDTEYAYIKHLETINEHYMSPLSEMKFLNIQDLKQLSGIVLHLIDFQRDFYERLIGDCDNNQPNNNQTISPTKQLNDDHSINKIVEQLVGFETLQQFKPIIQSISKTFTEEADRFKIYANYCAGYSKLQRVLHPRKGQISSSNLYSNSIASVPNNLDTFQTSGVLGLSNNINLSGHNSHHREFMKPLGSFMTASSANNESNQQLKQLNEFLGNLDSSSSSVSVSLSAKSSLSSNSALDTNSDRSMDPTMNKQQKQLDKLQPQSSITSQTTSHQMSSQKCVHQQNFESYLIKPIQRIVKYPMLLNSVLTSCQHLTNDENLLLYLKTAVKQMNLIASYVNENQKTYDEYGSIFEHIERQYSEQVAELSRQNSQPPLMGPHQPNISLGIDQLLYYGPVEWLNISEFTSKLKKHVDLSQTLFVFNSCVVFICREQIKMTTKKKNQSNSNNSNTTLESNSLLKKGFRDENDSSYGIIRYQSLIPVSEVLVRSAPPPSTSTINGSNNSSTGFQWELFRCSSVNSNSSLLTTKRTNKRNNNNDGKVYYLLSSPTSESRATFLRKIRFIIRESVQNMSLPIARCPSSKGLTPRKLSSPFSNTTTTTTTSNTNTTITNNTNSSCSQSTSLSPSYTNHKDNQQEQLKKASKNELVGAVVINSSKKKQAGNNQVKNNNFASSIKVNN